MHSAAAKLALNVRKDINPPYAKLQQIPHDKPRATTETVALSGCSVLNARVTYEVMPASRLKTAAQSLPITFGVASSPFGEALVARTARGICHLAFTLANPSGMQDELVSCWPDAVLNRDDDWAQACLLDIFSLNPEQPRAQVILRGSDFQIKVWQALMRTAMGCVMSYRQLSEQSQCPGAQRAVGTAMAAHRIAFLIPCHRVIRSNGDAGNYRWGAERKLAMLAWEAERVRKSLCPLETEEAVLA